jgi:hypothetical protein
VVTVDTVTGEGSTRAEYGATADADAASWHAYIAFLEKDGKPPEVIVCCPVWAEFEFGWR